MRILLAVFASGLLSACATPSRTAVQAPGSIFEVEPGNALVVVVRKPDFGGMARGVVVLDADTEVGEVGSGGQISWQRPAGPLRLSLKRTFMGIAADQPPIELTVVAGRQYVFNAYMSERGLRIEAPRNARSDAGSK